MSDVNVAIGNWPAWVEVYDDGKSKYVSIGADHNTGDYDTELDESQVRELRDALTTWLGDTNG